ncbi:MAG: hypothetical protein KAY24_07225 [Candidatus Eisenbacteria sp.]|nr:hypothetical protein [Candidatus Eisenbacteria bacterium]
MTNFPSRRDPYTCSLSPGPSPLAPQAPILCLYFAITALLLVPCAVAEWTGKQVMKDSVLHVMNPAEPLGPPEVYELRELWRLESEDQDGQLMFGTIDDLAEDGTGNLYVLDAQLVTVHVISPNGEYLRSIGQKGQGPGDLFDPAGVFITKDGTLGVADIKSMLFFTLQGLPVGEWSPDMTGYGWYTLVDATPCPLGYLLSLRRRSRVGLTRTWECLAGIYDKSGRSAVDLFKRSWSLTRGEPYIWDEEETETVGTLAVARDGSTFISPRRSEYSIHAFDPAGRLRMVIEREYEAVRRTKEEIADMQAYWRNHYRRVKNLDLRIMDFERNITRLYARDDGSLWVETSRGWDKLPPGIADILDVFDAEGRFIRQVVLKKDIDTANDFVFLLGNRALISVSGWSADLASAGVVSQSLQGIDLGTQPPALIMCELLRAGEPSLGESCGGGSQAGGSLAGGAQASK